MPRYTTDSITFTISHRDASRMLNEITDEQLIERYTASMFPTLTLNAWKSGEPEYETLPEVLRAQAQADLNCAYFGTVDFWCDDMLARNEDDGVTLTVLFDCDNDGTDHDFANPVNRLRALGFDHNDPIDLVPDEPELGDVYFRPLATLNPEMAEAIRNLRPTGRSITDWTAHLDRAAQYIGDT